MWPCETPKRVVLSATYMLNFLFRRAYLAFLINLAWLVLSTTIILGLPSTVPCLSSSVYRFYTLFLNILGDIPPNIPQLYFLVLKLPYIPIFKSSATGYINQANFSSLFIFKLKINLLQMMTMPHTHTRFGIGPMLVMDKTELVLIKSYIDYIKISSQYYIRTAIRID